MKSVSGLDYILIKTLAIGLQFRCCPFHQSIIYINRITRSQSESNLCNHHHHNLNRIRFHLHLLEKIQNWPILSRRQFALFQDSFFNKEAAFIVDCGKITTFLIRRRLNFSDRGKLILKHIKEKAACHEFIVNFNVFDCTKVISVLDWVYAQQVQRVNFYKLLIVKYFHELNDFTFDWVYKEEWRYIYAVLATIMYYEVLINNPGAVTWF